MIIITPHLRLWEFKIKWVINVMRRIHTINRLLHCAGIFLRLSALGSSRNVSCCAWLEERLRRAGERSVIMTILSEKWKRQMDVRRDWEWVREIEREKRMWKIVGRHSETEFRDSCFGEHLSWTQNNLHTAKTIRIYGSCKIKASSWEKGKPESQRHCWLINTNRASALKNKFSCWNKLQNG